MTTSADLVNSLIDIVVASGLFSEREAVPLANAMAIAADPIIQDCERQLADLERQRMELEALVAQGKALFGDFEHFLGQQQQQRDEIQLRLFDVPLSDGWSTFGTDGEAIKIGYTSRTEEKRRREYQTGNPRTIRTLIKIPSYPRLDSALRKKFHADRIHGDWFRMSGDLVMFIEALQRVEIVFGSGL